MTSPGDGRPWTAGPDWLSLRVRLTPHAGRDSLDAVIALADGTLVLGARVRALPQDGEANAALIALLSRALKIPRSAIRLVGGATSRIKDLRVEAAPEQIVRAIERLSAVPPG